MFPWAAHHGIPIGNEFDIGSERALRLIPFRGGRSEGWRPSVSQQRDATVGNFHYTPLNILITSWSTHSLSVGQKPASELAALASRASRILLFLSDVSTWQRGSCVFRSRENAQYMGRLLTLYPEDALEFLISRNRQVAVISAKNHKRQRRKRQSVTAKREKSQMPKVLTAILT